jgi:hypothetical protein
MVAVLLRFDVFWYEIDVAVLIIFLAGDFVAQLMNWKDGRRRICIIDRGNSSLQANREETIECKKVLLIGAYKKTCDDDQVPLTAWNAHVMMDPACTFPLIEALDFGI